MSNSPLTNLDRSTNILQAIFPEFMNWNYVPTTLILYRKNFFRIYICTPDELSNKIYNLSNIACRLYSIKTNQVFILRKRIQQHFNECSYVFKCSVMFCNISAVNLRCLERIPVAFL